MRSFDVWDASMRPNVQRLPSREPNIQLKLCNSEFAAFFCLNIQEFIIVWCWLAKGW